MKKILLALAILFSQLSFSQMMIDTLAMQNFDSISFSPNWAFTGPVVYNTMGVSGTNAAPANSPTGIGNSRSWESTTQSSGLVLTFSTIAIPVGYDSIRARFSLAAMNLISTGGGPDNLDYVLTEVSVNGGTYYSRLRIRGAVANNSYWPYNATGKAKVYYQPQTEAIFAPTNTGLQTNEGYSYCEIVFPGSITSVSIRMTGRSSSSTDSWLVDNVLLTGEKLSTGINSITNTILKVYPNPANETLFVNRLTSSTENLSIFNAVGELVISRELNQTRESINISNLNPGIYIVKSGSFTKKIIKQNILYLFFIR